MINILPDEEKRLLRREYRMRFVIVVSILLSLSSLFAFIMLVPSYLFSNGKATLAENRLATWNTLNKDITLLDTSGIITDTNNKLILLSTTSDERITDNVFGAVLSQRISGITFHQILYNEQSDNMRTVEIHGVARDRATLRAFKNTLESSALFRQVDIPLSTFLERSNISFTASLTMK